MAEEVIPELNGTISYVQFAQSMMRNKHLINSLFKPIYNKGIMELNDKLKEIAVDYVPLAPKELVKRAKAKKKRPN